MRIPLFCAALLLIGQHLAAQPRLSSSDPAYAAAIACADSAHKAGNFARCAACYETAFALSSTSYVSQYKAAQCLSMAGDTAGALAHLRTAIQQDFEYACPRLRADEELDNLRQSDNWPLVEASCALAFQQIDQDLQRRLDSLYQEDQRYRPLIDSLEKILGHDHPRVAALTLKQGEVDDRNLRILTKIILSRGYPGKHMVARSHQHIAFMIMQHANGALMELYLPAIEKAVAQQDLAPAALAIAEDVIAHHHKKPQLYGTQIYYHERHKRWELWKIQDPEALAERRAAKGMEPIEAYLKKVGAVWEQ